MPKTKIVAAPIAKCPMGSISGRGCVKPKYKNAKQVFRYSGIPFAKPPVGDLRFEAPQKLVEPWKGVMDGTKLKTIPIQNVEMMSSMDAYFLTTNEFDENFEATDEDCLYLKVYTSNPNPNAKLPVMFWIYGGDFQMGGTAPYDGAVLSSLHDVVVVTANYRVNVFGLLSFKPGETTVNGNMGLLDQCCALEWVRDNIAGFGGDPNNVTIFGESAGGGSVLLHMMSEKSKNLFHKAICHSGVSVNSMVLDKSNDGAREKLLETLKITEKDPRKILKKLKELPAEELSKASDSMMMEMMKCFYIALDGEFLSELPDVLVEKRLLHHKPFMIGFNSTEGYGILAPGQDKGFYEGINMVDGKEALQVFLAGGYPPSKNDEVFDEIWSYYEDVYPNIDDPLRWTRIVGDCVGDSIINMSAIKVASTLTSTGTPTYFYRMSHQLKFNHDKEYQPAEGAVFKDDLIECDHGDDIYLTFGDPFTNAKMSLSAKFSDDETRLCEQWMGYLTNFASTGNPNKGGFKPITNWEQFGPEQKHLSLNSDLKMQGKLYEDRFEFWDKLHKIVKSKKGTKF